MEIIHGYTLIEPFVTANAGTACWTIAVKGGRKYFLKRFDSPKYTEAAKLACMEYEARKAELYRALADADNGNIIYVTDFFREDTYYYSATEFIEGASDVVEAVSRMDMDRRLVVLKTLTHSMMRLAQNGIVHSDLKPTNIMLKYTIDGYATIKLIDFDSGYLVTNPPASDDLEGDQRYLSPEALKVLFGEEVHITPKADVFALGVMFHEFFTGEQPGIPTDECDYLCEAVLGGLLPVIDPSIPEVYRTLIAKMLLAEPDERISVEEVFKTLKALTEPEEEIEEEEAYEPEELFEEKEDEKQIEEEEGTELFKKLGDL